MAFNVENYGTGALGDVADELNGAELNSYAAVSAITANSITFNNSTEIEGAYEKFSAGTEILFHVSASTGASYSLYLGKYATCTITAVNANTLTVNKDLTKIIPADVFNHYYCQIITIAQFKSLTLNNGVQIVPITFNATNHLGGIVALKAQELTFAGGHINLTDRGIPVSSSGLRPKLDQEKNGTKDTDKYAGWENALCMERLPLNAGDGAAFVIAKKLTCHEDSRIGNVSSYGVQFCRGAEDFLGSKPANITNIGGSSILICAEEIDSFNVKMISKYRSSQATAGKGLARAYIASNTKLVNDEGLYAYDCVSNPTLPLKALNIKDFGDGSAGNLINYTNQVNNYAKITSVSENGKQVGYTDKTTNGFAQIATGALVMIHNWEVDMARNGRFFLAKVLADNGSTLTLNAAFPDDMRKNLNGIRQIVAIPMLDNFTLSTTNAATPKFNDIGGIFAICVKNSCRLNGGIINMEGKGRSGSVTYELEGGVPVGNAQMNDRLMISTGTGSVFIIAQNLEMDSNTRIGATHSGAAYGGKAAYSEEGGFAGVVGSGTITTSPKEHIYSDYKGGWSGTAQDKDQRASHGGHVFILADTITNFNQAAISTGGLGGTNFAASKGQTAGFGGGAGYGGGGSTSYNSAYAVRMGAAGGYKGGGGNDGGFSGWSFIWCNNAVNQNTADTSID